jgi:hypothetical protein
MRKRQVHRPTWPTPLNKMLRQSEGGTLIGATLFCHSFLFCQGLVVIPGGPFSDIQSLIKFARPNRQQHTLQEKAAPVWRNTDSAGQMLKALQDARQ